MRFIIGAIVICVVTVSSSAGAVEMAEGEVFVDPLTGLELESPVTVNCSDLGSARMSSGLTGFDACRAANEAKAKCTGTADGTFTVHECDTGEFAHHKYKSIWIYYNSQTDGHMKAQGSHGTHQNYYWYTWWNDGVKISGTQNEYPYNHVTCDEKQYFEREWGGISKNARGTKVFGSLRYDGSINPCETDAPLGRFGAGATW